jgi:hypothetical protein
MLRARWAGAERRLCCLAVAVRGVLCPKGCVGGAVLPRGVVLTRCACPSAARSPPAPQTPTRWASGSGGPRARSRTLRTTGPHRAGAAQPRTTPSANLPATDIIISRVRSGPRLNVVGASQRSSLVRGSDLEVQTARGGGGASPGTIAVGAWSMLATSSTLMNSLRSGRGSPRDSPSLSCQSARSSVFVASCLRKSTHRDRSCCSTYLDAMRRSLAARPWVPRR